MGREIDKLSVSSRTSGKWAQVYPGIRLLLPAGKHGESGSSKVEQRSWSKTIW